MTISRLQWRANFAARLRNGELTDDEILLLTAFCCDATDLLAPTQNLTGQAVVEQIGRIQPKKEARSDPPDHK